MASRQRQKGTPPRPRGSSAAFSENREAMQFKMRDAVRERAKARRRSRDVRIIEQRIQNAINEYDPYYAEFQRNLDFAIGNQGQEAMALFGRTYVASEDILHINRLLPALRTLNANIMPKLPYFYATPERNVSEAMEDTMQIAEYVLNYTFQHPTGSFLQNCKLAVLGAEVALGGLKFSHMSMDGMEPPKQEDVYGEIVVSENPQTGEPIVEMKGGTPLVDKRGNLIRRGRNRFLVDSRNPAHLYRSDVVDFRNCVFDPEGTNDFRDHSWFAERVSWTYEEFMANKLFTNKDGIEEAARYLNDFNMPFKKKRLQAQGPSGSPYRSRQSTSAVDSAEKDMMRIWGYQFWDFKKRVVSYVVDDYYSLVGAVEIPRWLPHSPYSWLKFNEVLGEWMAYPDVTAARPVIRSYNQSRSLIQTLRQRAVRKFEARKGDLDANNKEALKNGDDLTVIESKTGQSLRPVDPPKLDQNIQIDMDRDIADFNELIGVSAEARQGAGGGAATATQAAITQAEGTISEEEKRRTIATFLQQHAEVAWVCIRNTLDTPMAVRIVGPRGNLWQGDVQPDEIDVDASWSINVADLRPHDDRAEKADAMNILQIMGPEALLSDRFSDWFWRTQKVDDPEMREELKKIMFLKLTGGISGDGQAPEEGGGEAPGGPKPPEPEAEEEGRTFEGRSFGRAAQLSGTAGQSETGGF